VYNYGNGVDQPHIDMFIIYKEDDTETPYHAFMKNEKEKHIEHLTSKTLKGTWNYVQTNDFAGWGKKEGPAVSQPASVFALVAKANRVNVVNYSSRREVDYVSVQKVAF
jgi:hypothetical protein